MKFFYLFSLIIAITCSCNHNSNQSETSKPNIIIFYADDLGYGDLSSYGSEIPTPNIDRIGKNGIRFTDFHVSAPGCTPSRYSLMTGAYPNRSHHGLNTVIYAGHDGCLDTTEIILPQYLKEVGYKTAIVGKWHLGNNPLDHGFDRFSGMTQGCIDYFTHVAEFPLVDYDYAYDWNEGRDKKEEEGYSTHLIGDYSIKYMDEFTQSESPFLLYVAFNAPHYGKSAGEIAPEENTVNLRGDDPKAFENVFPSLQAPNEYLQRFEHVDDIYRKYYSAMVSAMDDNVGRIWQKLEEKGLLENTIVWFISDNGGYSEKYHAHSSNGPLRDQKGTVYEGGIRIPALMSWPVRVPAGQVNNQPLLNADLLPTFAHIIGFEEKLQGRTIDGKNISDVIFEGATPHREIYWHYDQSHQFAYRSGDWKIVEDELYNLAEDISESNNLTDTYPEKYRELRQKYDSVYNNKTKYQQVK